MIEKSTLRKIYALYKLLFFSITFAVYIHAHIDMNYSVLFFIYLLDATLLFTVNNPYFDMISLGIDVAFSYFLAQLLSIKELIAFSIVPLFFSCMLVDLYLSLVLLSLSVFAVFFHGNISRVFASISYAASFASSCLLNSSLKQRYLAKKREAFNREFEEKLSIAKKLSLEFAHEIRNPLMAISGAIEMIKNTEDEKIRQEMIELAQKEIEKANNLTRDFLNLEKPKELLKECFELCGLLDEIKNSRKWLIEIEIGCETVPIVMNGDRNMIMKMLDNLIRNSLEAKATKVYINVSSRNGKITLIVEDNGEGINLSDEDKEKIFLPFFTTKEQGSGLGLSICKQVAEAHGGYIEIYNSNAFKIVLEGERDG